MDDKPGEKKHVFDDPRNIRTLLRVFYVLCILLAVLDVVYHRHIGYAWETLVGFSLEGIPGFYAIYGFVACVLLVLIAKEIRKVLMRDEDYYDDRK